MSAAQMTAMRAEKDRFFKTHPQSPLSEPQQALFTHLEYYPHNPALDLTVTVERFADDDVMTIETTTGEIRRYRRYGRFAFDVDGETVQLTIYETPHGYFLPFTDANANKETYGGGRYLDPEMIGENMFAVDFNVAYNPYCAYDEPTALASREGREPVQWSCPLTPFENRLKVAIRAGEKLPVGEWVNSRQD